MSEKVPLNNVPVYLQKYTVSIFDEKSLESKGAVQYGTVGAIPSNKIAARVWDIQLTGQLEPNVEKYKIVYDFSNVDYKYKKGISFENTISGTFRICGQIIDASKIMSYEYSDEKSLLSIIINTKKWGFKIRKKALFSYSISVDDSSCPVFDLTASTSTPIPTEADGVALACTEKTITTTAYVLGLGTFEASTSLSSFTSNNNIINFSFTSVLDDLSTIATVQLSDDNSTATIIGFTPQNGCSTKRYKLVSYYKSTDGDTNKVTLSPGSSSNSNNVQIYIYNPTEALFIYYYCIKLTITTEDVSLQLLQTCQPPNYIANEPNEIINPDDLEASDIPDPSYDVSLDGLPEPSSFATQISCGESASLTINTTAVYPDIIVNLDDFAEYNVLNFKFRDPVTLAPITTEITLSSDQSTATVTGFVPALPCSGSYEVGENYYAYPYYYTQNGNTNQISLAPNSDSSSTNITVLLFSPTEVLQTPVFLGNFCFTLEITKTAVIFTLAQINLGVDFYSAVQSYIKSKGF